MRNIQTGQAMFRTCAASSTVDSPHGTVFEEVMFPFAAHLRKTSFSCIKGRCAESAGFESLYGSGSIPLSSIDL